MYVSNITDKEWYIYDICGNLGWIGFYTGLGMLIGSEHIFMQGTSSVFLAVLEIICAAGILVGLLELINERIHKLDRRLSRTRLFRGFGSITVASLSGMIITGIHLVIIYANGNREISLYYWMMIIGELLCFVFCGLLWKGYKKEKESNHIIN